MLLVFLNPFQFLSVFPRWFGCRWRNSEGRITFLFVNLETISHVMGNFTARCNFMHLWQPEQTKAADDCTQRFQPRILLATARTENLHMSTVGTISTSGMLYRPMANSWCLVQLRSPWPLLAWIWSWVHQVCCSLELRTPGPDTYQTWPMPIQSLHTTWQSQEPIMYTDIHPMRSIGQWRISMHNSRESNHICR